MLFIDIYTLRLFRHILGWLELDSCFNSIVSLFLKNVCYNSFFTPLFSHRTFKTNRFFFQFIFAVIAISNAKEVHFGGLLLIIENTTKSQTQKMDVPPLTLKVFYGLTLGG